MSFDRSLLAPNRAATERMRALAARLSEAELQHPVGQHWTVAIVYAHLAFWDRRVQLLLEAGERDGAVDIAPLDHFVNDVALPFWAAMPPHAAVRLALETASRLDARLEGGPEPLLAQLYAASPRYVLRALHRNEHLDEAEKAVNG